MSLSVEEVATPRQLRAFIRFPWRVYKGNPNWVPPLLLEQKQRLDPRRNPFYLHAKVRLFLARRRGTPVGRIAAIVNHNHNRFYNDRVGFFGFFEVVEDFEAARLLFDTATRSLAREGMEIVRGPMSFSTNEECGLLISGYDQPPYFMMPYNPPYYAEYLERYGFAKAKDLLAFYMTYRDYTDRVHGMAQRLEKRNSRIRLRTFRMDDFDAEAERIRAVFNAAWEANWGFVPFTDEEFYYQARQLKQVADPDLVFVAEDGQTPVGFLLAVPDFYEVLHKLNGRLFPFGLPKILWHQRRIRRLRILLMGVVKAYRGKGVDIRFYDKLAENAVPRGIVEGEFSWILEDNRPVIRVITHAGARHYKTYRVYDYPIQR